MKLKIESTDEWTVCEHVPFRTQVWRGVTARGVRVTAYVQRVELQCGENNILAFGEDQREEDLHFEFPW